MKSSLKKSTNSSSQILNQRYDQSNGIQQPTQAQSGVQMKAIAFGTSTFQPIKTTKQSQKLRIAQMSSTLSHQDDKNIANNNTKQQKQSVVESKPDENAQEVKGNDPTIQYAKQNARVPQNNNNQEAQIAQIKQTQIQNNGYQTKQNNGLDMRMNNQSPQKQEVMSAQIMPSNVQSAQMIKTATVQDDKQVVVVETEIKIQSKQDNPQIMIVENQNTQMIGKTTELTSSSTQNQMQTIKSTSLPFDFKVQNRNRNSSIRQSMIEDIPEGYQERDLDKEKMDIRRLFKNNNQKKGDEVENEKDKKRSKEIEDKIYNPQMNKYKGDQQQNQFFISVHTKLLKPFPKISSVVNFSVINKIDPQLRFYHLLYELIDQTEKTVQHEYSSSPEFLHYLNILINKLKFSFSKIATNRRKSIIMEQQQEVKECLYNRWEVSKQKVMQNMINKYLKKYDKFKKIEDNIDNSREYTYLKKNLQGLVVSSTVSSVSQREVYQKIEEKQKQVILEIEQAKNIVMKPINEGQSSIQKGETDIINQQNKMAKSYEKLTKIVFTDWKEIDSFDEIAWLSSQQQPNQN